MSEELTQCIDSGKITAAAAETLSLLSPGAYCLHRSWGFGKVAEWRLLTDQIIIDFKSKKGHAMQPRYVAETVTFIPNEHILARVAVNPEAVREEAKKDPVALIKSILKDHGNAATVDEIAADLIPEIFDTAGFKRWFDGAKKKLKADGHFLIPTKKTAPIELQENKTAAHYRLLEQFRAAHHPKEQVVALDGALKLLADFSNDLDELSLLFKQINEAAERGGRIHAAKTMELLLARDEIGACHPSLPSVEEKLSIVTILSNSSGKLSEIFSELPSAKYRRILAFFPAAFNTRWTEQAQQLLRTAEPRLIGEIFNLFEHENQREAFATLIIRALQERSASSDFLKWICESRTKTFPELINHELLSAILSALERDMHGEHKRGARLQELLFDDRQLIADLLGTADLDIARTFIRKIMISPAFNDLDRRSLLARILKVHPELELTVTGDQEKKAATARDESLVVSWASLERRKSEYENLITKLIPQNTRDISTARSYGDLRENFEFKSAKEQQGVLLRQKGELELMLNNARGTNFENPDTSVVSIGTVITFQDVSTGKEETYTILGAWDSLPEKGWISYKALIGQALLGHKIGEKIDLPGDSGKRTVLIKKIEAFNDVAELSKKH
ncbi:MAG: GreA/GreB family elongation factor [Chthoniobacterales bacterium]